MKNLFDIINEGQEQYEKRVALRRAVISLAGDLHEEKTAEGTKAAKALEKWLEEDTARSTKA